jgi:hypothetical protein
VGIVAPSDIPYCGEDTSREAGSSSASDSLTYHAALYQTKSANANIPSTSRRDANYEMPDFLKQPPSSQPPALSSQAHHHHQHQQGQQSQQQPSHLPAIYTSSIRSDKETALTPSEAIESGLAWQKADYV